MILKDCWYVAALGTEVTTKPLGRRIAELPIVLYRTHGGDLVALEDRCCHRGLPLSMGEVIGDNLRCNYHGLEYDSHGRCVRIPGQDLIPPGAEVRRLPVRERGLVIWVWVGNPARASDDLIPPFPWHDDPAWAWKSGVFRMACNYEMLHDNLLDLSHIAYVHRYTIGGDPETHFNAETRISRTDRGVRFVRLMPNSNPPPTYAKLVAFAGPVDRWQEVEFTPGLISLYSGAVDMGAAIPEGERKGGFQLRLFDAVTPESETSTHNFFCSGHNFRIDESSVTDALFADLEKTVWEDIEVLDAQQARSLDLPSAKTIDIRADAAGIQARLLLQRLKRQEIEASRDGSVRSA
jgi:vanillate O-demethylase monooxygenase subunit